MAKPVGSKAAWKDLTCSFTLALVPIGFSMWVAHFSNHFLAGWSSILPAVARFISHASSANFPQEWIPNWLPSLELCILDFGLLLTLYVAWRIARSFSTGDGMALATLSPWAVLAGALYSIGIWIVFQPMQIRGMLMRLEPQ